MKKIWLFLASFLLIAGCTTTTPSTTTQMGNTTTTEDVTSNTTVIPSTIPSTTTPSSDVPTTSTPTTSTPTTSVPTTSAPSSSNSSISQSTSSTPVIEVLDTPILTINEATGVVTWNAVKNATHYNYIINDGEINTSTTTTLALTDQSTVSVQAANSNNVSDWSNAVTFFDVSDVIISEEKTIYATFHNTDLTPVTLTTGQTITKPADPVKENYIFDNWYADPFYREVFDFNTPLYDSTIIYANYTPSALIDDVYFWIKGENLMSSAVQSSATAHDWRFIPLKVNTAQTQFKEFMATVTVSGTTSSNPCNFIIMDGFDDNPGRTYWKYDNNDFAITSDGVYDIYFSVESQYLLDNVVCNAFIVEAQNTANTLKNTHSKEKLNTPVVTVNNKTNTASWEEVNNASYYEVIINNKEPSLITENSIELNKKEHITVRAVATEYDSSNWSVPKANLNYVQEDNSPKYVYVYYHDSNLDAQKVSINTNIEAIDNPSKDGFTFAGWYLDIALTKPVTFPYTVTKNTVFYPKWNVTNNYETDIYFNLVDSNNKVLIGFTWNLDNFDFIEYETQTVTLSANTNYYIKSLDNSKSFGPYKVETGGDYRVYFSEENIWDAGKDTAKHAYFAKEVFTLYFTNSEHWSGEIKAYMWSDKGFVSAWPGTNMTYVRTNGMGQDIYKIEIDKSVCNNIIFTNGSYQTVDISLNGIENNTGFYTNGKNGSNFTVGTWAYTD